MEAKQEFGGDHHLNTTTITGTSFSQLLLGDDDNEDDNALGLGVDQTYTNNNNYNNILTDYSPIFPINIAPQMLCFGNYQNEEDLTNALTSQKSVITNSSDSSSASSCNHTTTFNSLSKPHLKILQKKRNGSGQEPVTKAGVGNQRPPKKTKADNPTSTGHAKRKEKLGERIAALQQLVSPFGKTDTASVLHEAMGYIKFLQDQVQVLCSPYLQRLPYTHHQLGGGDNNGEEVEKDLRSRGLCLIPVQCTVHVASSNGADFWSPAALGNNISPSTTMH